MATVACCLRRWCAFAGISCIALRHVVVLSLSLSLSLCVCVCVCVCPLLSCGHNKACKALGRMMRWHKRRGGTYDKVSACAQTSFKVSACAQTLRLPLSGMRAAWGPALRRDSAGRGGRRAFMACNRGDSQARLGT